MGSPGAYGEVCHPPLVRPVGLELPVQHVVCNRIALALVLGQPASPRSGTLCLLTHQPLDTVQSAVLAQLHYITPYTTSAIGAVAEQKALAHLSSQHLVTEA